jgi:acyl-CoA thioester hydrolase
VSGTVSAAREAARAPAGGAASKESPEPGLQVSSDPGTWWRYRHTIRVRYGEVDQQGVVFNAHYLAFVDDSVEHWLEDLRVAQRLGAEAGLAGWDFMLKKATIEWQGSVGSGDRLVIGAAISRWGRSSFEAHFRGTCGERRVFDAAITYVTVKKGENRPYETPAAVRAYLGDAVTVPA